MTCVSANWDIPNVRCERNPSCELWDEEMLLEEQEREREQDRERVAPPINLDPRPAALQPDFARLRELLAGLADDAPPINLDPQPAQLDLAFLEELLAELADDAPRQQERTEVNFDWLGDPGRCIQVVSSIYPDSE
jgi:hypothetical protein